MKTIRYIFSIFLLMLAVVADAQQLRQEAFELINLDYPGLEKVNEEGTTGGGGTGTVELLP